MKRRVLSILLTFCLVAGLLPATALAADTPATGVTVGGVEITETGWYPVTDGNPETKQDTAPTSGGCIHWDADTGTLTLHNAAITGVLDPANMNGEDAHGISAAGNLTIELEGANAVTGGGANRSADGISVGGKLTVMGAGSLTAAGGAAGLGEYTAHGINATTVEINGCTVTAAGGTAQNDLNGGVGSAHGINADAIESSGGSRVEAQAGSPADDADPISAQAVKGAITVYEENTPQWHDGAASAFTTDPLPTDLSGYAYLAIRTTQHAAAVWLADEEAKYYDDLQDALDYAAMMDASYKVKLLADAAGEYTAAGPMSIYLNGHALEALTVNPGADTNEIRISGRDVSAAGDVGSITNLTVSGGMATLIRLNVANITMNGGLLYPTADYADYAASLGAEYTAPKAGGSLGQFAKHVDPIEESIAKSLFATAAGYQIEYKNNAWYLKQKISSAVTFGPDRTFTYNGQPQGPAITVNGPTEDDYTVSYGVEISGGEFGTLDGPPTSAGEDYKVTVAAKEDSERYYGEVGFSFKIAPAPLTITAADQVVESADNAVLSGTDYAVAAGLVGGDYLDSLTLDVTGTVITPDDWTIRNPAGSNVTRSYEVTTKDGKLLIAGDRTEVEIQLNIPALVYNGKDLSSDVTGGIYATVGSENVDVTDGGTLDGYTFTFHPSTPIDAGAYTVTASVYNSKYAGSATKIFSIAKRPLTLIAADITADKGDDAPAGYTYSGEEGDATYNGLAVGHKITTDPTLSCTPNMSTAGSYPITIDVSGVVIKDNDGAGADVTANYDISGENGTLTVSAPYTPPSTPSYGGGDDEDDDEYTPAAPIVSTGDQTEGGATTTTTTATPNAATRGDTATATVSASVGNQIVQQAKSNDSAEVVIAPTVTGDVTRTQVSIPASTVGSIGEQTAANLTVSTPVADVTIPNGGLSDLASAGGTVTVTAEKVGNTVTLEVTSGGETVSEVTGGITLTVPHDHCGPGTVAMLVHEDGTREVVRKSVADGGSLTVTIPLDGSATLEIVDNSTDFEDVAGDAWYNDAVDFVGARGLFGGVSTTEAIFDGDGSMTRGMLAVVLHRLENNPDHTYAGGFDDIPEDTWYTEAVLWAAENGIVSGYGDGGFGAEDDISREQLAVMLWRYAGSPESGHSLAHCPDAGEISGYARQAMAWANGNGVINGKGGSVLDPGGRASRAEVAQMLMNFLRSMSK